MWVSGWVSEWVSEYVSEWVSEWVGEYVSECATRQEEIGEGVFMSVYACAGAYLCSVYVPIYVYT